MQYDIVDERSVNIYVVTKPLPNIDAKDWHKRKKKLAHSSQTAATPRETTLTSISEIFLCKLHLYKV